MTTHPVPDLTGKRRGGSEAFWAGLPLGPGVELIRHDENGIAAFSKPVGVLSHPNRTGEEARSLLNGTYDSEGEIFEWGGRHPGRLWLLNRLDSATSGVILMATSAELARVVKEHFRSKQVRKVYQAVVFSEPRRSPDTWRDTVEIVKRDGRIRTAAVKGGVPVECRMTVERVGRGIPVLTLIRLEPRTGRSHQLRVQCAKRHFPIVGDQTYGDFKANREFARRTGEKRLFLHSHETEFYYAFDGKVVPFTATAPVPPEFGRIVE